MQLVAQIKLQLGTDFAKRVWGRQTFIASVWMTSPYLLNRSTIFL